MSVKHHVCPHSLVVAAIDGALLHCWGFQFFSFGEQKSEYDIVCSGLKETMVVAYNEIRDMAIKSSQQEGLGVEFSQGTVPHLFGIIPLLRIPFVCCFTALQLAYCGLHVLH